MNGISTRAIWLGLGVSLSACVASERIASVSVASSAPIAPAASTGTQPSIEPLAGPADNLQRQATWERSQPAQASLDRPPVPPGLDPAAFEPHPDSAARARASVEQAIREISATSTIFDSSEEEAEQINPAQSREALRAYAQGREFAAQNNHSKAVNQFIGALRLDPNNPRILRELARSLSITGNEGRAVVIFQQLLPVDPDNEHALFVVGVAATERRDFDLAVATLGRPRLRGFGFNHDRGAPVIADFHLARALRLLGYDRAAAELTRGVLARVGGVGRQTRYRRQVDSIYRQRPQLVQDLGDIDMRLGAYDSARRVYEEASSLRGAALTALLPRLLYVDLCLGQRHSAQKRLLDSIRGTVDTVGDREILLCGYLYEHGGPVDLLAEAVGELYLQHPARAALARAAASMLPTEEGLEVLTDFLSRRPRDLDVVRQLVAWTGRREILAAVRLIEELVETHPDLARSYIRQLAYSLPEPMEAVATLRELPRGALRATVHAGLLRELGAIGPAWSVCVEALDTWPDDASLKILRIELAGALDEPPLVDHAIRAAADLDSDAYYDAAATARASMGEHARAVTMLSGAVSRRPDDARLLTTLARARAMQATTGRAREEATQWTEEAIQHAQHAWELDPDLDEPYSIIAMLVGPGGAAFDLQRYGQLKRRFAERLPQSRVLAQLEAQDDIAQGRFEKALERLLNLYDSDPGERANLALAVNAWSQLDRLDDAERWLAERLEVRPGDPGLLEYWMRVQIIRNRPSRAVTRLEAMLQAEPGHHLASRLLEAAYQAQHDTMAMRRLREPRLLTRPRGTRREVDLATMEADSGMTEEAATRLQWISQHVADAKREHLARAVLIAERLALEEPMHSVLLADLALASTERFPDSSLALYRSGLVALVRQGEPDRRFRELARRAVQFGLSSRDDSQEAKRAWFSLAQALVDEGHPAAAAQLLRLRLATDEGYEQEMTGISAFFAIAADSGARDNADLTIGIVEQLVERGLFSRFRGGPARTLPEALYEVSQLYSLVGNDEGVDRILGEALKLDPGFAMAMNNLGYMYVQANRDDAETIRILEKAHRILPSDPNVLDTIGWLRYKQGIFSDEPTRRGAESLIRESLEHTPNPNPEVMDHLADTLWRLGQPDKAIDIWREVTAVVDDPRRRERIVLNYGTNQQSLWGLLIKDPEALYDAGEGALLERLKAKLKAVEDGDEPVLTPTFAEVRRIETDGKD